MLDNLSFTLNGCDGAIAMIGTRDEEIDGLFAQCYWWEFKENRISYLTEFVGHAQHPICSSPPYIAMKRDSEGGNKSAFELKCFKCLNVLPRRLNLHQQVRFWEKVNKKRWQTLIASMQIAAMTSSEPLSTQLSGKDRPYSQIVVAISTTTILVMWSITSTFARLTTWPRHLWYSESVDP